MRAAINCGYSIPSKFENNLPCSAINSERSIIVAEDAPDTRLIVISFLEFDGYDCIQAVDGKEVIELAKVFKPKLVILDLMLPQMDGFQVLLNLQKLNIDTKVCVISSLHKPEFVKKAFHYGAENYLIKPVLPEVLLYKVKTILGETSSEEFFAANSNLRAELIVDGGSYDSCLCNISEVGVKIRSKAMPKIDHQLITLKCDALQKMFGDTTDIFIKRIKPSADLRESDLFEFIALKETRIATLREAVAKGKFISQASYNI